MKFIKLLIITTTFAYLIYKIYKFKISYTIEPIEFSGNDIALLLISLMLMILNWTIEAIKWQQNISHLEKTNFKQSFKSILMGLSIGLTTPSRVGELYGRILPLKKGHKIQGALVSFLGSFSMLISILVYGSIGIYNIGTEIISTIGIKIAMTQIWNFYLLFFSISLIYLYFNSNKTEKLLKAFKINSNYISKFNSFKNFTKFELLKILILSLFRYLIFSTQFYLLLIIFNVNIDIVYAYSSIFCIYLIKTFIPIVAIADISVRGSLSILILGIFNSNELGILIASSTIWLINIGIPSLIGTYLYFKHPN